MKILILSISLILSINLKAQMDSVSYSAGLIIAKNLKTQGFTDLDPQSFLDAINDVYQGKELKISLDEANQTFRSHVEGAQARKYEANKTAGADFLSENGKKPNVKTTESGLQYEVLDEADANAAHPSLLDQVKVHYHGTLLDGTVFDSSVERNEPASFPLNRVIVGWQEGLQLMTVGSKYRFYIPYNLAYGDRAAGAAIQPFSTLIFDVTLLAIE